MDPNSHANFSQVQTTHFHLDLHVDFEAHVLRGHVVHRMQAKVATESVILDTKELTVQNIAWRLNASSAWQTLSSWSLDPEDACFGQALRITLPTALQGEFEVKLDYETKPSCSAVQWLKPQQTAGKVHPYLFTQCQAIHARTMMPCQDTPAVKATYTSSIRVPKPLRALMSALSKGDPENQGNMLVYGFEQKIPIPSYLLALAVGALKGIEIGPRSTVWSEDGVVQKAAWEFEDTEKFISTAEELITPYAWGRYDVLVLPPSFPFGGMENPVVTFATPTLLAGDRSLVDVVAHEISHSWAGNLTTNTNWQHFWLNEGFCVFIERKIAGRVHGEDMRQFSAILGWKALKESVEHFGMDNPLTKLVPDLKGVDPDDAFSSVPYEKGFNLLYHLEQVLGGPSVFEPFVKTYYQTFCFKSLTTDEWKAFLYDYVRKHHPEKVAILDKVEWQKWLHEPGMPPIEMPFDTKLANVCYALAKRWDSARSKSSPERRTVFPASEFEQLSSNQRVVFLERLGEYDALSHHMIEDLAAQYSLMSTGNSEIRFRWQQLCLKASYAEIFPAVVQFITEQGRMKFTRPLYRALSKCGKEGEQLAKETFLKHRDFYHPICAQMVAKDLHLELTKK